jgi:hypothetical protein
MTEVNAPTDPNDAPKKYSVGKWDLDNASVVTLEKWASDPLCIERDICAERLASRGINRQALQAIIAGEKEERLAVAAVPFDPRTEISADARHIAGRIVKHLWILFVLLPFIVAVLLALVGAIK